MSNTNDKLPENSLPLTIREKVVNLFEELEGTKDDQRQVNIELNKETQARIEADADASHLRQQVQLAEVNLDNTTTQVNHLTTEVIEVVKASEAARQYELIFSIKKKFFFMF